MGGVASVALVSIAVDSNCDSSRLVALAASWGELVDSLAE